MATVGLIPEGIEGIETGDLLTAKGKIDIETGDLLVAEGKIDIETGDLLGAESAIGITTGNLISSLAIIGLEPLGLQFGFQQLETSDNDIFKTTNNNLFLVKE